MSTKPQIIQFDWSGTISDDRKPVHAAFNRLSEELGVAPIEKMDEWIKHTVIGLETYIGNKIKLPAENVWKLYVKHFENVCNEGIRPYMYEEVVEVLQDLKSKGKKMIVVSAHPTKSLIKEAEEYGIAKYFEDIVGNIADKSDSIRDLPKRFGTDASQTIYIGDMISDVRAAKKAGVPIVALTRGYHTRELLELESPHHIWDTLYPAKTEF